MGRTIFLGGFCITRRMEVNHRVEAVKVDKAASSSQ